MEIKTTADGSVTLFTPQFGETYHSINGAVTESVHVFINAGLKQISEKSVHILEIGFGTGLNAYLTKLESEKLKIAVHYFSLEKFPIEDKIYKSLNYSVLGESWNENLFLQMHRCNWEVECPFGEYFKLTKLKQDLLDLECTTNTFHVVYFDAFSPVHQPELWTISVFEKLYKSMVSGGVLTTYCSKGEVRRNMQFVGFKVERIPGPPGKREMLRARK